MLALDWNVLVTVYEGQLREARTLLAPFGRPRRTYYRNVLVMKVDNTDEFLEALRRTLEQDASLANAVSRIVPVTHGFQFSSAEEFERNARDTVDEWVPELYGKKFHVRMHRRGFKGKLSSQHEEQFLDHHLPERLKHSGAAGEITFDDPDVVIAVETLDRNAGLSRWTRQQLHEYELLKIE